MIYQLLDLSINRKYIAIYFDNQVFVSFALEAEVSKNISNFLNLEDLDA